MESNSVSRVKLILEIRGKAKLTCVLKRHLSPRTVGIVLRSLPLEGNAHLLGSTIAYMETPVESGIERKRNDFKKGDIAFLPDNGSICFYFEDTISSKTMTPIGKLTSNIDELKYIKSGDAFSLYHDAG